MRLPISRTRAEIPLLAKPGCQQVYLLATIPVELISEVNLTPQIQLYPLLIRGSVLTLQVITCSRDLLLMTLKDALQADAGAFEQVLLL